MPHSFVMLKLTLLFVVLMAKAAAIKEYMPRHLNNVTGRNRRSGSCVDLTDTVFILNSWMTIGIYSKGQAIEFDSASRALMESLFKAATTQDISGWQLCMDMVSPISAPSTEAVSLITPDVEPIASGRTSSFGSASTLESGSVVAVDYLIDTEAAPDACSTASGYCNFRSAVAYCALLLSWDALCTVSLPSYQIALMNTLYGDIKITSNVSGELIIEGNGCTVLSTSGGNRLLYIESSINLNIQNMTIKQFGDPMLEGGVLHLRGLRSLLVKYVTIESTAAAKGGALFINECDHVIIEGCIFVDTTSSSDGGAIYVAEGCARLVISFCTFTGTLSGADGGAIFVLRNNPEMAIIHCTFTDTSARSEGGAIFVDSNNNVMLILDCRFRDTSARFDGGAIFVDVDNVGMEISLCGFSFIFSGSDGGALLVNEGNDRMTISSSTFSDISADSNGGAVSVYLENYGMEISNCSFSRTSAVWGGAINVLQHNYGLSILDCLFDDVASNLNGGAILVRQNNFGVVVSSCVFIDTSARSDGGAIYVFRDNFGIVISGCSFAYTSAGDGGGILISQFNDWAVISNCSFFETSSVTDGGALLVFQDNDAMDILNCNFSATSALFNGGSMLVYQDNDGMLISDCFVSDTSVGSRGGAILVSQDNVGMVITGCSFRDTYAGRIGGALFFYQSNHQTSIADCSFTNSVAADVGGAIAVYQGNDRISISNCSFWNASAGSNGGAIYLYQGNDRMVILNCFFRLCSCKNNGGALFLQDGNFAVQVINGWFDRNHAGAGGGAIGAVSSNNRMITSNSTFFYNIAGDAGGAIELAFSNAGHIVTGCMFVGNQATTGGGIYVGPYHSDFILKASSIESGIGTYGGGVYIARPNDRVVLFDTTLHNNSAYEEGGGLYSLAGSVIIDTCILTANRVIGIEGLFGGASLAQATSADILNTTFANNSAGNGGALGAVDCGHIRIHRTIFASNIARVLNGGAIFGQLSAFHISGSSFLSNMAGGSGGALCSVGAINILVSNCSFHDSLAISGNGAAVWLSIAADAEIVRNVFDGNKAPNGGGTVYWVASTMTEPRGVVSSNVFFDTNYALYGRKVATESTHLSLNPDNVYNMTNYEASTAYITVYAHDYYNHIDRTLSGSLIDAVVPTTSSCFGSSGFATGGVLELFLRGVANFSSLELYCAPGFSMPVTLATTVGGTTMQTSFNMWFRECVTGEYYGESVCIYCERGSFSVTDPGTVSTLSALRRQDVCKECPSGASSCYGNVIQLKADFWRISTEATSPLRCPYTDSCKGGSGTGDELCSDGYEGPACGVCADDFAFRQSTQNCEPCSDSGMDAMTILIIIMITLCALMFVILYCHAGVRKEVELLGGLLIFVFVKLRLVNKNSPTIQADAAVMRQRISIRLKTYVMLWQIVSLLPNTLDLSFPNSYEALASVLNALNLRISVSSLVSCSSGTSFDAIDTLILATLYPIIVTLLIFALRCIHLTYCRAKSSDELSSISARYFGMFLAFMYLILPSVSITIFQTFSCRDVDPDDVDPGSNVYMSVDYTVSCGSSKYQLGFAWAVVSILVYPVGVPLYYFYLVYTARGDIQSRHDAGCSAEMAVAREMRLRPIRLLFDLYTPDMWYWEVVETAHRLMLTGVLVVISRGSGAQVVVGAVVSLVFLKVCDVYQPYAHNEMQTLREICQWQIFALFFLALLIKADFPSVDATALAILLILAIVANVFFDTCRNAWLSCFIAKEGSKAAGSTALNPMSLLVNDDISKVTIELTEYDK